MLVLRPLEEIARTFANDTIENKIAALARAASHADSQARRFVRRSGVEGGKR